MQITAKLYRLKVTLISVALVFVPGCASLSQSPDAQEAIVVEPKVDTSAKDANIPVFGVGGNRDQTDEPVGRGVEYFDGNGRVIGNLPSQSALNIAAGEVALNFEDAPLVDVLHGILGDILQLNYRIEGKIPGTVTVRSQKPIAKKDLLVILESMLASHDIKMVFDGDSYIITSSASIGNRVPAFYSAKTKNPGFKNIVVPLEYISAAQMADILRPVATDSAFVRVDDLRNILILAGTQTQLNGWLDIIDTFDVDYVSGMSVAIYPIEYNTVEEVSNALSTLLSSSASDKSSVLTGMVRVEPLDTLGSILVVSTKKEYLKRIETWIERLDRSPEASIEPQLFVYDVKNANADHLASLISQVFGGSSSGTSRTRSEGVAPGLNQTDLSGASGTSSNTKKTTSSQSSGGSTSFNLDGDTRIVADESNNALLIYATHREYKKIESALKKLDIMPSQVLIEASIIEVTLKDSLQYGLEWYFDNELNGGRSGTGNIGFNINNSGEFSGSIPSFGYAFTNSLGDIQAILDVLAKKELLKVLSTPSLMVLDNQSASIKVGNSFAVLSSTTNGEYGSTQNISYRDTGVNLEVTPSVNAGGLVTMDIAQSVSTVGSEGVGGNPSFFEREIQSKVAVRSGDSVILGGLISDSESSNRSGIPFLSDLPLIGWLFGGSTVEGERQELLVILTPHVMKTDQDLREITQEMRARMKGLKAFEDSVNSSRLIGE